MKLYRNAILFAMLASTAAASGEIPAGYYSRCEGKSGKELLAALCTTISEHQNVGYDGLWDLYTRSDIRPDDGSIWDMYSTKHWTPAKEQCGNYSAIGSCYNREHSFPKSWFGGKVNPMYADAFHLYPTDGMINSYRGNLPFGECTGGTTWSNGSIKALGRRGTSTFPGYSGEVFEPDDLYKGDFARSYFYMAACYNDRIAGWESPMLAGNAWPAFTSWAAEMLVKWHRQDPVSPKETTRNEVVSLAQHNRNPFIDHPELAEHIWGNKSSEPWYSQETPTPQLILPAEGAVIDLGISSPGVTATTTVSVSGAALTGAVALAVSGGAGCFSVSPASLAATDVNASKAQATISFTPTAEGKAEAILTLATDGAAQRSVALRAEAVEGIPLYDPTEITEHSFTMRWRNVSPVGSALYTVDVSCGGRSIEGYPRSVEAAAEQLEVTDLEPATTYTYSVSGDGRRSRELSVTTAVPTPAIRLYYDAELTFATRVDIPSEEAEIVVETDNIDSDITIAVSAPFELSTDHASWARAITLTPDEDRFYMRLNSDEEGNFTTAIVTSWAHYTDDNATAEGVVSSGEFIERFENASEMSSYNGGTYVGTAATWIVEAGNIWDADRDFNNSLSMRFNTNGLLQLAQPKQGGAGTVSVDLRKWDNKSDGAATVELFYSTDGGTTWQSAGSATTSEASFSRHTFTVNASGNVAISLRQTAGKRFNVDNLAITDYAGTSVSATYDYHRWDAWGADGRLQIRVEDSAELPEISVYDMEGRLLRQGGFGPGVTSIELPAGVYLVATDRFSRRVMVR